VGFAPVAPGTVGSALGVAIFLATHRLGWVAHIAIVFAVGAVGTWAAGECEKVFGRSDDGRIVIDEVVGQWVALAPLFVLPLPYRGGALFFSGVVTAFVAFRLFDIAKPWPVYWAEQRFSGGFGVMADDLLAGLLAAVGVWASLGFLPQVVAAIWGGTGA